MITAEVQIDEVVLPGHDHLGTVCNVLGVVPLLQASDGGDMENLCFWNR